MLADATVHVVDVHTAASHVTVIHAMPCYCILCSCRNCRGHIKQRLHLLLRMLVLSELIFVHAKPTNTHAALHKNICLRTILAY